MIYSFQVIRKQILIKGVFGYKPEHLREAIEFLSNAWNEFPFEDILSVNSYSLGKFEEAVQAAVTKTFYRVCIRP